MSHKPQIRIVKRDQQGGPEKAAGKTRAAAAEDSRRGARAVAENVSSWVEEFKERSSAETRRTFASLFAERAKSVNTPA